MFKLEGEDEKPAATVSSSSDASRLGSTAPPAAAGLPNSTALPTFDPMPSRPKRWKAPMMLARALLLVAVLAIYVGHQRRGSLPNASKMVSEVRSQPTQTSTTREPFTFTYRGNSFDVTPKADYELSGVVVTHNNISGIGDIYHTSDSVDMKDLCVVWGSNVQNDNYRNISYTSAPWTCVIDTPDSAVWDRFFMDELSNNHLLAGDETVQERIRSVRIGDQISLRGMLVNYSPAGHPDIVRKTSLVRDDIGNGACEVVFVEDFKILKRATPGWYLIYQIGWWLLGAAFLLRGYIFVKSPYGR